MGFNNTFIILEENYQQNTAGLANALSTQLEYIDEVNAEEALSSDKEDDFLDVVYAGKGTLLLGNLMMNVDPQGVDYVEITVADTASTYILRLYVAGQTTREWISSEGEIQSDEGQPLSFEQNQEDFDDVSSAALQQYMGVSFQAIFDLPCYRYRIMS